MDQKAVKYNERPKWAADFEVDVHEVLRSRYMHKDFDQLMKSGRQTVLNALNGPDRELALIVLKTTSLRTPEQFDVFLKLRKNVVRGDKTAQYLNQTGLDDAQAVKLLDDAHIHFKIDGPDADGYFKVTALGPEGAANTANRAAKLDGSNLVMKEAFIYDSDPWIKAGLTLCSFT